MNLQYAYRLAKRLGDIVLAGCGLLVLSPLFLLVALAIVIEEPGGPVFFSQIRVGTNGKLFRMYKFRSMATDAEARLKALMAHNEVAGATFGSVKNYV